MSKSLLVADNSITIQKSVGITFAQEDFKITYVDNGEDAVTKIKQIKPDVVLADVEMPKKNGYEVCQAVKSDPETKGVPVLLLAGTHEPFDEARGKQAGADGYVIKPFESQALIDRVNEMISGGGVPQAEAAPQPQAPAPQATTPPPGQPEPPAPPEPPAQAPTQAGGATSPAATIAGQSLGQGQPPQGTDASAVPAEAPMLDLEAPSGQEAPKAAEPAPPAQPQDESFDFSFDAGLSDTPQASSEEQTGPISPPASAQPPAPPQEESDIWDFDGETEVAPSAPTPQTPQQEASPTETPSQAAPSEASPVETPAEMANWGDPGAPESEESAPSISADSNEFGFDLSPEPAEPTSSEAGAEFSMPSQEQAGESIDFETDTASLDLGGEDLASATPSAEPTGEEFSFGEPPPLKPSEEPTVSTPEPEPAFESPTGMDMTPEEQAPASAPQTPIDAQEPASADESAALPAGLTQEQTEEIVRRVFKDVIERIAWEVVPDLAETIIREELERLTKES